MEHCTGCRHSYSALPSLRDSRRPTAIELVNSGPCHVCATPPPAVTEDTSLTRGALLRCPRSCEPPDDALAVSHNTSCGEFHDQLHVCVNAAAPRTVTRWLWLALPWCRVDTASVSDFTSGPPDRHSPGRPCEAHTCQRNGSRRHRQRATSTILYPSLSRQSSFVHLQSEFRSGCSQPHTPGELVAHAWLQPAWGLLLHCIPVPLSL